MGGFAPRRMACGNKTRLMLFFCVKAPCIRILREYGRDAESFLWNMKIFIKNSMFSAGAVDRLTICN